MNTINNVVSNNFNLNNKNNNNNWQKHLNMILRQRRGVLNFKDYLVSEEHKKRMIELANTFPEIFDNPSRTPRSKWFNHPKYAMNIQMPQFHVHFRQEMQSVLAYLAKTHQVVSSNNNSKEDPEDYIQAALRIFTGSMQGLHGHVHIEERAYFPIFQNLYHHIDFQFLYEDHEHLHETESILMKALKDLTKSDGASHRNEQSRLEEELVGTIQLALDFDQELMTHLGEEEEIIVPMSLALEGHLHM